MSPDPSGARGHWLYHVALGRRVRLGRLVQAGTSGRDGNAASLAGRGAA